VIQVLRRQLDITKEPWELGRTGWRVKLECGHVLRNMGWGASGLAIPRGERHARFVRRIHCPLCTA
jgi:hypothetical protein